MVRLAVQVAVARALTTICLDRLVQEIHLALHRHKAITVERLILAVVFRHQAAAVAAQEQQVLMVGLLQQEMAVMVLLVQ
jgi:hypothetical protein